MIRIAYFSVLLIVLSGTAATASCDVDLKPTDKYQELSTKLRCLEDRINALEDGRSRGTGKPGILVQASTTENTQEADRLRLQLQSCTRKGQSVSCGMTLTTISNDSVVAIWNDSLASDNAGAQSTLAEIEVNGKKTEMKRYAHFDNEFVSDVPVFYRLSFDNISSQASQIAALKIYFKNGSRGNKTSVTFRGIDIK
jgi:hypothetical protein